MLRVVCFLVLLLVATGCTRAATGATQPGTRVVASPSAGVVDPGHALDRAEAALLRGRLGESLQYALWCYDHGIDADVSFWGVWISRVPELLGELAARYAPAKEAALLRMAAFEERVAAREPDVENQMLGLVHLYDGMREHDRLWRLLVASNADQGLPPRRRARLVIGAMSAITAGGRYDLVAPLAEEVVGADRDLRMGSAPGADVRMDALLLRHSGVAYESLLRTGQVARAVSLSDSVLAEYDTIDGYGTFVAAARRAGEDVEVTRILMVAARTLSSDELTTLRALGQ
jgi:hypothetical protein